MNWITRCPECATVYQVVPEQLQAAKGWLRCGQCQRAFDSTGLMLAWSKPPAFASHQDVDVPAVERLDIDDLLKQEDRSNGALPNKASIDLESFEQALSSFKPEIEKAIAQLSSSASWVGPAAQEPEREPSAPEGLHHRWIEICLCLLALSFLAQVIWIERHALSARWPVLGGPVERVCRLVGCAAEALRDVEGLVIDTSSFTQQGGAYELQWVVRNTTAQVVMMTALELTLLDVQGKPVLRRVFLPSELGAPQTLDSSQVWEGRLQLRSTAEMAVTGYRVLSFYP